MPSETGRRDDVSRQIEVHIHRTTQHNNGPERTSLGRRRPCTNFEESRGCGPPFAIFHSQTSFLRRENRKSGACYNKRQYCITQKRARDTGRGTPSLGMQHSAGRSLASRCGVRVEERYKRISAWRASMRTWSSGLCFVRGGGEECTLLRSF